MRVRCTYGLRRPPSRTEPGYYGRRPGERGNEAMVWQGVLGVFTLTALGMKSIVSGTIATCLTGAVAGVVA